MPDSRSISRLATLLIGIVLATALGIVLFWAVPTFTPIGILSLVLIVLVVILGTITAARIANRLFPDYTVAEVEVANAITRDGQMGPLPFAGRAASADDIVEQIERADADSSVQGLIVKLNTPGGEVVPSEDIRQAVADFDGPTVAYAEDMAASGGYWIASGADEIHARRGTIVGSIGVNGVQLGREELRDKLGLEYRRFVVGDYKDSPSPWRAIGDDEVAYFQGLLEGFYEQFVETVVEGTELEETVVEDTQARLYLGNDAAEMGLVDACGSRQEMEDRLAERIGIDEVSVSEFEPQRGIASRARKGAESVAHAFGAGIASAVVGEERLEIRV